VQLGSLSVLVLCYNNEFVSRMSNKRLRPPTDQMSDHNKIEPMQAHSGSDEPNEPTSANHYEPNDRARALFTALS
jgi:hypothetical protein